MEEEFGREGEEHECEREEEKKRRRESVNC